MDESRRHFMAAMAALMASTCLPSAWGAAPRRSALSQSLASLKARYDVVVVGSGYGGAVMAARLAAGRTLCVLERGREWLPQAFPSSSSAVIAELRSEQRPLGLFDYRTGVDLDVLVGNGLGGTSLINANVVVSPDRDIFQDWPAGIRADYASGAMAAHEQRVRQVLAVEAVAQADGLRKQWFHETTSRLRGRQGGGASALRPPLAVNLTRYPGVANAHGVTQNLCTHCGDCVIGCRFGAKNSLDANYLPLASQNGAELFSGVEVSHLERVASGDWRVHYTVRPAGDMAYPGSVLARHVILSAGTLGTTQILLRSRQHGLRLSSALGRRFSTNGDLLSLAYNTRVRTNTLGFGEAPASMAPQRVGPTITAAADYRANRPVSQRFLIEDGAIPSALVDAVRLAMPMVGGPSVAIPKAERMAKDLAGRSPDGALNHSMVYLGIGHDSASGRLELDSTGRIAVRWPLLMQEPFVSQLRNEMAQHAAQFDGELLDSPRTHPLFGGALTTVHPLGGCPMGDSSDTGVVNASGQVYDPDAGPQAIHAGLYAVDGSILPGSVGVNPLLTIAALAERVAAGFMGRSE